MSKKASAAEEPECAGDPFNIVYGHVHTFPQVDFVLGGTYDYMVFSREYYSVAEYDGPFGYGWTHSYNFTLTKRSDEMFEFMNQEGKLNFFAFFPGKKEFQPGPWNTYTLTRELINPGEPHPLYRMICIAKDGTKFIFPDAFWKEPHVPVHVSAIEYKDGRSIKFVPDDGSLPTQIIDPHGRVIRLSYSDGRVTEIFEPGRPPDRPIRYGYDEIGNLTQVSHPVSPDVIYTRRYYYQDPNDPHNLTRLQDEHGFSMSYEYDQNGRCILTYGDNNGQGPLYKYINQYKPEEHQTVMARCRGTEMFIEVVTYNNTGHIVRREYPDSGEIEKYKYITKGGQFTVEKTEIDSSQSSVFRKVVEFDEKFNVTGVSVGTTETEGETPDTLQLKISYNDPDNPAKPTSIVDQNDNLLEIPADALDKIEELFRVKEAEALGRLPDIKGFLAESEDGTPSPEEWRVSHDEHGLVQKITGGAGHETGFLYDGAGRIVQLVEKKGDKEKKAQVAYDWLGRVTKVVMIEPNGETRTESYEYDAPDKFYPNACYAINKIGYDGKKTQFVYRRGDFLWKVVQYENGGVSSITTYEYDSFGNLIKVILPDGRTITATYDSRDRLIDIQGPRSLLEYALS